jgi:cytochrome b subunit of formate dehydrogenase
VGTAVRWLLVVIGLAIAAAGAYLSVAQSATGAQPWTPELSDNFVFMRFMPFALALGAVVGIFRASGSTVTGARRGDEVRRFSLGTVIGHWVAALGFMLALPTGLWQYLGGILDVTLPIPLYVIYRVHYIGAALVLFSVTNFLAYWWINGDRSLLVSRGEWRRHLTGFASELPRAMGARLAGWLRLDLTRAPQPGRFTFYETAFSFPTWTFALALITITGIVKAMRYIYPIPGPVLFWASTLHVAAMVLLLLKVLDHLRYTLARWPMMVAMAKGWVNERALRRVLAPTAPAPAHPAEPAVMSAVAPAASSER